MASQGEIFYREFIAKLAEKLSSQFVNGKIEKRKNRTRSTGVLEFWAVFEE